MVPEPITGATKWTARPTSRSRAGAAAAQRDVGGRRAHREAVLGGLHVVHLQVVGQLRKLDVQGQALLDRPDQTRQYRRQAATLGGHLVDLEVDGTRADGEVAGGDDGGRDPGDGDRYLHPDPAVGQGGGGGVRAAEAGRLHQLVHAVPAQAGGTAHVVGGDLAGTLHQRVGRGVDALGGDVERVQRDALARRVVHV